MKKNALNVPFQFSCHMFWHVELTTQKYATKNLVKTSDTWKEI